jgi:PAS domain S-box-containing protein
MPYFICPRCKSRRVDHDGREGFSQEPPSCRNCDFGFMFELLEDYYPAQATGFVVLDQGGRVLATGRGVFELTGYEERDLMGREVAEALQLSNARPLETAREWGVRQLEQNLSLRTNTGLEKRVVVDVFPAYDDDGGLLVALTPG